MTAPTTIRKEMRVTKTAAENNQAIASKLSNNLPRLLRELSRDFDRRICEGLAARGHICIRTSHSTVLGNLGMGDVRVTELARHSQMTQQAMGKILRDLERLDYVKRSIDDSDKRAKVIQLTTRPVITTRAKWGRNNWRTSNTTCALPCSSCICTICLRRGLTLSAYRVYRYKFI
jgi:DNA-binding MarR family transcriptional regulator